MKLCVLLLLPVLSCMGRNQVKAPESKISESKKDTIHTETIHPKRTVEDRESQIRDRIRALFRENNDQCNREVSSVTDFNGRQEFWRICPLENGNRIIWIESHKDPVLYTEVYFEQNGTLIYAQEVENYMPLNHYQLMPWNCEFFIEQGKIVALWSLGHGKTELDDWDPNSIFHMYDQRMAQLSKIARE